MKSKIIHVSVVVPTNEYWYHYKFGKIKDSFYNNKKYDYCVYRGFEDIHLLRKLEIYGKKFNIKFDHLENNYNYSSFIIFINGHKLNNFQSSFLKSNKKKILVIIEPAAILPTLYNLSYHENFDLVFSRDKTFLNKNQKKYKYFNGNCMILKEHKKIFKNKKKNFLCIIFKNKYWHHKQSSSSLRLEIVEWYNKYYPNDLDLYGRDWDKNFIYLHKWLKNFSILRRILLKLFGLPLIRNFFSKSLKIYKGETKNKINTLSQYKFDICIENAFFDGAPGERIYHSLLAGTVPIFILKKTKTKYIPTNCYIDFWKFNSLNELNIYLKNMSDRTYDKYIANINKFIKSNSFFKHTVDFNAINIVKEIYKKNKIN